MYFSDSFILTTTLNYNVQVAMSMLYNVDIKLILFEICLIHKIRQIIIKFINKSSHSNHATKFTVLVVVVVAFATKENRNLNKQARAASSVNTDATF